MHVGLVVRGPTQGRPLEFFPVLVRLAHGRGDTVRGIVGDSLTPEIITRYVSAFAHLTGRGKVILGRDTRPSGEFISLLAKGTFVALGCEVIDLGIVPTPTVQLMTEFLGADAGLVVTASHNPSQWNGLKFIGSDGLFLSPENHPHLNSLPKGEGIRFSCSFVPILGYMCFIVFFVMMDSRNFIISS